MRWVWMMCAVLMGCAQGSDRAIDAAVAPLSFEEAKQLLVSEKARVWKDPGSIRDARVGRPFSCVGGLGHLGMMPDVCVCVELNAKNALGGYTGLQKKEVLISGRTVVDVLDPRGFGDRCGPMEPFPEMNADYLPPPTAPPAAAAAPQRKRSAPPPRTVRASSHSAFSASLLSAST